MRPSDEHQHRSKRPNLFSSSRGKAGADDNILARLERMPADGPSTPAARTRTLLLGGAALLIMGLIGTLAVLTRENAAPRPMPVGAPAVAAARPAPSALDDVRATVLDEAPAEATSDSPARPAAAVASSVPELANPTPAAPADAAPRSASVLMPSGAPRTAALPPASRPAPPAKPALGAAKPAPAKAPRRPAAADDPDVAILTAILSQTPRHAPDQQAEAECGGTRGQPCPSGQF